MVRMRLTRPGIRLAIMVGGAGLLFGLAALLLPHSPSALQHVVRTWGWAGPILFVALWAALTPALFSGTVLATAAGLLFGAALGTALGVLGATLGALVSFGIARRWGMGAFQQIAGKRGGRLELVQARVARSPFRAVLALRLMPGMPATWLNYAVGLTRVRPVPFAAASALGGLPRVFIYAGLSGGASHGSPVVMGLSIGLFVLLTAGGLLVGWRERRSLRAFARPVVRPAPVTP
jgi:uncharacterized membrane protein YdjX (TVP38/TMEM64 family)